MCNRIFRAHGSRWRQRGVSLILVLFLLVVLSLLAAAMAQLNRGSSDALSLEIQSARALLAAESGAQLAAVQLFPLGGAPGCAAVTTPRIFAADGLANCTATLTCAETSAAGRTVYTVTSTGVCGSGNDRARRRIRVGLRSL